MGTSLGSSSSDSTDTRCTSPWSTSKGATCENCSLGAASAGSSFRFNLAAYIITEACKGLDYAHRSTDLVGNPLEIIHRDVSPQNILLSWDGAVKICDFGIAKAQNRASQTQAGVLKGKFAYMSPEQVRGKPIDHRSDIFGLGVIAHEMVAGRRLFLGESDFSTLQRVRKADVRPLTLDREDVEEEFSDAILGALKRDPKGRYPDASEFASAIQPWLINGRRITGAAELSAFLGELYAAEIAADREKMERFLALEAPPGLAEAAAHEVRAESTNTTDLSITDLNVDEDKTVIFDSATMQPLEQINTDGEKTVLADPLSFGDGDATILAAPAGAGRVYAVSAGMATLDDIGTSTEVVAQPRTPPPPPPAPPAPTMAPPPPPPGPVVIGPDPRQGVPIKWIGGIAAAVVAVGLVAFALGSSGSDGGKAPQPNKPAAAAVAQTASVDAGAQPDASGAVQKAAKTASAQPKPCQAKGCCSKAASAAARQAAPKATAGPPQRSRTVLWSSRRSRMAPRSRSRGAASAPRPSKKRGSTAHELIA